MAIEYTDYKNFSKDDLRKYNPLYFYKAFTEEDIENLDDIVKFCQGLIIKDQEFADRLESNDSMMESDLYIRAKENTLDDYYSVFDKDSILRNYKERNPYYGKLQNIYDIDPYVSRTANDFDIIKISNHTLDKKEESLLLESYSEALNYFKKVTHTRAFNNQVYYREMYYMYLINATIHRYINKTMYRVFDVDRYTKRDLKNAFISNGLDYFDDFPLEYQRRTYKRINDLIRNKGTNEIFPIIEDIFSINSIDINKYYLAKHEDDLKFYKTNVNDNLDVYNDNQYGYNEIIDLDPYWRNTKEEVMDKAFNVIQTKYLSTDAVIDIINNSKSLSFLYSLINLMKEDKDIIEDDSFNMTNSRISSRKFNVFDGIVTLNTLVINYIKWNDRIKNDKNMNIYGYNFNADIKDTVDDIRSYIYSRQFDKSDYTDFARELNFLNIKKFKNRNTLSYEDIVKEYEMSDLAQRQFKFISEIMTGINGSTQLEYYIENDLIIDGMRYLWTQISKPEREFDFKNISYYKNFMEIYKKFLNVMIHDGRINKEDVYLIMIEDNSIDKDIDEFVKVMNVKFLDKSYQDYKQNKNEENIDNLVTSIRRSIDYSIKNKLYTPKKQITRYPALNSYISDILAYSDSDKDLINIYDIIEMYKYNEEFRKELEELIYNSNDPHLRKKFTNLHKQLFITNSSNDIFKGFKTYSDYLKFKEPDLYYYTVVESEIYDEDVFDRENIFRERIFELVSSIDNHLNLKEQYFTNSNFVGVVNFIRDYITILITLFKSYTTDLIYTSLLFKLDDKFENSIHLIDEGNIKYTGTTKYVDKINTLDNRNITDKIIRKENIEMKDNVNISIIKREEN
ncbi:hypothetical protein CPT_Machias_057 [Staphylococcus phage Machias]|nr:hypothetical protein CPT_Machias_057 [Staphylococcus phage Machias]